MINCVYLMFFCIIVAMCTSVINKDGQVICSEIPSLILEEILGGAFNARYMSIDLPIEGSHENGKRTIGPDLDFHVDSEFYEDLNQPAWNIKNHVMAAINVFGNTIHPLENKRFRRDMDYLQEWQCKSRIKWTDLGPDYFPRYLRSVECLAENCWFNIYKCRPKSFTVKILKRKRDRCVTAEFGTKVGTAGLPRDLTELWVWEERAVIFCCDCSM